MAVGQTRAVIRQDKPQVLDARVRIGRRIDTSRKWPGAVLVEEAVR